MLFLVGLLVVAIGFACMWNATEISEPRPVEPPSPTLPSDYFGGWND